MLTKEQSRSIRAKLGLSQRRTAAEAGVPRSYLNQFEMGRWIPTDAFLSKLVYFYGEFGRMAVAEPALETRNVAPKTDCSPSTDPQPGVPTIPTDELNGEEDADSGDSWRMLGTTILAIGLVGGILAVTGNLPAALFLVRRAARGL